MPTGSKNPNITAGAQNYASKNNCSMQTSAAANPNNYPYPRNMTLNGFLNDITQGACVNCYFIAALYSAVWANYTSIPIKLIPDANGIYSINFTPSASPTQVKSTFPVDAQGNLVFAQLTPQNELWVALYEKAYAKYLKEHNVVAGITWSTLTGAVDQWDPEISSFPQYVPMTTLSHITGCNNSVNYNPLNLPQNPNDPNSNPYASSFDLLNQKIMMFYTVGNITNGRATSAAVAWTYDAGSLPAGYENYYLNLAVVPNHTYSVIGTFANATTGKNYVVLRNPWGNRIVPGDASFNLLKLAAGTWKPSSTTSAYANVTFGNLSDGIFAIESAIFDHLFTGFGWVY